MNRFLRFFHSAHPVKKTILFLWGGMFFSGIIFSLFYLAENGIEETFTMFFGNGITFTTVFLYWGLFLVRTFFFIPVSLLMISAPFIFGGFWEGLLMAGIGEIIGAVFGFFFARYYGKEFVLSMFSDSPTLGLLNEKMEKFGGLSVGLLRMTPITFDLINFGAGISNIRFSRYFLATFLSVWPDCLVYVSLGGSISNPLNLIYTVLTLLILGGVFWYLSGHPEYKEMFVMEVSQKTAQIRKKMKSFMVSKRKRKGRGKKRF